MYYVRLKFDILPKIMFAHNSVLKKNFTSTNLNPYHEITFIESGRVEYTCKPMGTASVGTGEFIFSPANTEYSIKNSESSLMHSCVAFFLDAEQAFSTEKELEFEKYDNAVLVRNESIYLPLYSKFANNEFAFRTLKGIIDESKKQNRYSNLVNASHILDLLVSMASRAADEFEALDTNKIKPSNEYYCEKIESYLKRYFANDIDLSSVAEYMGLHPNYISNIYKKTTGNTIMNVLMSLRQEEAKKMILQNKYAIKEIAAQVGFVDFNYFSNVFKKKEGVSPSTYLKNIIKKEE